MRTRQGQGMTEAEGLPTATIVFPSDDPTATASQAGCLPLSEDRTAEGQARTCC